MPTSVTYTAVLTMNRDTVEFLSRLLAAQRRRRRTRRGRRALGCFKHAVLVVRWFLDGTRIAQPNGHDLWWSGKHKHHGGNVQVISVPDGWPLWVSDVRPGREHDITCARHHGIIDTFTEIRADLPTLADLGYEGAGDVLHVPVKKPSDGTTLTDDQKTFNKLLRATRALGERANALLIMRFKALRRVSLDPWRIGAITQAALVLLHHENNRTW